MQSWVGVLVPAFALLVALIVPGALFSWILRLRPTTALAAVVPISVTTISVCALVTGFLGPYWGLGAVAVAVAVMSAIAWGLRKVGLTDATDARPWSGHWWLLPVGTVIAATLGIVRSTAVMGNAESFPQTYDSVFHANLLWSIGGRADASPLHVNLDATGIPSGFYPTGWHSLVSLVDFGGIPEAMNASVLVLAWIVAPVGIAALVGTVTRSWTAAGIGALFTGALGQFPLTLTWFGLVYPVLLGTVLIPFVLALIVMGLLGRKIRWMPLVLAAFTLPGLALAQPSTAFSVFYLAVPIVVIALWRRVRWWSLLVIPAAVLLDASTMAVSKVAVMRSGSIEWANAELGDTLTRLALFTVSGPGPGVGMGGLARVIIIVFGIVVAFRLARGRWLPFSLLIAQGLFLAAAVGTGSFRAYVTGVWYGDIMRLGPLIGVIATALFALGVWQMAVWAAQLVQSRATPQVSAIVSGTLVIVLVAACQMGDPLAHGYRSLAATYQVRSSEDGSGTGLTTEDAIVLMSRADDIVPEGAVIAGNPWTGSSLVQVYGDRAALFPHLGSGAGPEAKYLAAHLNDALDDPEVCEIVNDLNVRFVLDLGPGALWGEADPQERFKNFDGFTELDAEGVAQVVDQEGQARLLEITACD